MKHPRAIGDHWEGIAESFLRARGLKTIQRNFNCRLGEIDLIMQDGECVVFTEIRYRRNPNYGTGAETVTLTKQRRIIRAAQRYLQIEVQRALLPCRFDVISMGHENGEVSLDWIRNAFTTDGSSG